MKISRFISIVFFAISVLIGIIYIYFTGSYFNSLTGQGIQGSEAAKSASGLHSIIILFYVWILAALFVFIQVNLVGFLMTKKAKNRSLDLLIESEAKEVSPQSELNLIESREGLISQNMIQVREKYVRNYKNNFLISFKANIIIALIYLVIPFFLIKSPQKNNLVMFVFPILLLFWNVMSFLKFKYQIQAYGFSVDYSIVKKFSLNVFLRIFGLNGCSVILILNFLFFLLFIFENLLASNLLNSITPLIMQLMVVIIYIKAKLRVQKRQNLRLLILRVFGIEKTAKFTFTTLVKYWKNFGTYFTVVDPIFYRIILKRKLQSAVILRTIIILIIFFRLIRYTESETKTTSVNENYLEQFDPSYALNSFREQYFTGLFLVLLLITTGIILIVNFFKTRNRFLTSAKYFSEYIDKQLKQPTTIMQRVFKSIPVMCFDNTWKMAIKKLCNVSDIVLMDLRGYSEKNTGCEYEVDYIFDNVLSNKIVFLANQNSVLLIRKMIFERWSILRESSPNLNIEKPTAQLYITNKENEQDIQGILDSLFYATVSNPKITS